MQFKDLSGVPTVGSDLEGVHYIVPLAEDNLIFGKKDKSGFFACKTTQGRNSPITHSYPSNAFLPAIIIAVYEGEGAAGAVRTAVEKLAKYFGELGY